MFETKTILIILAILILIFIISVILDIGLTFETRKCILSKDNILFDKTENRLENRIENRIKICFHIILHHFANTFLNFSGGFPTS